jgi:hypothetical protein
MLPFFNSKFPFSFAKAADATPCGLLVPSGTTVPPANVHNMIRTEWLDRTLWRSSLAGEKRGRSSFA